MANPITMYYVESTYTDANDGMITLYARLDLAIVEATALNQIGADDGADHSIFGTIIDSPPENLDIQGWITFPKPVVPVFELDIPGAIVRLGPEDQINAQDPAAISAMISLLNLHHG